MFLSYSIILKAIKVKVTLMAFSIKYFNKNPQKQYDIKGKLLNF